MFTVFAQTSDASFAMAFGVVGLSAQLAWPLFRSRDSILAIQLAAACSYAASYSLMGQTTAVGVCLTGAAQTAIALLANERPWATRLGYLFLPVVLALGVFTYSGVTTALAIIACCLTMIGRMQPDTLRMRGIQLTASPFGAAHDVFVGAWPCLAGAVVSFAIALTAFFRELQRRHHGAVAA